jgi:histidine ammonia-lyase
MLPTVMLDGHSLTIGDVVAVARHGSSVAIADQALAAVRTSRAIVEAAVQRGETVYGVNTGFGKLAHVRIAPDQLRQLQVNLIRSHAAGVGEPLVPEALRAMMLLRANVLLRGTSGVRPEVPELIVAMLNRRVHPRVPALGSVGASGDLAPLSHLALALIGEGEGGAALRAAGLEPITLEAKEGLAFVNGTQAQTALAAVLVHDAWVVWRSAHAAAALSLEAVRGTPEPFDTRIHDARPHPFQQRSAAILRQLLVDSEIRESHRENDPRVQDAYSLRCSPQVHGAARDTVAYAATVADRELSSVIDNPVVLADGRVESNGNFHGAPVAYALDFLAIPLADVASIAERRTDRMLDVSRSHGLPPFLADDPGVDSGHMIAQYTQAAIVSELKRLAVPASVDSIPSSAMQEDHVSMGWSAARKLRKAVDGLTTVLAIELLTAARALDLRAPLKPAPATAAAVAKLRETVEGPGPDRHLAPEIAAAEALIRSGALQ